MEGDHEKESYIRKDDGKDKEYENGILTYDSQYTFSKIFETDDEAHNFKVLLIQHPIGILGGGEDYEDDDDDHDYIESEKEYEEFKREEEFFTCSVCWENCRKREIVRMDFCGHYFCKYCVREHFKYCIFNGLSDQIHCMQRDCSRLVSEQQIQTILSKKIFKKYLKFKHQLEITKLEDYCWCPRPGCENSIQRTDKQSLKMICDKEECQTIFCFDCKVRWHEGITCLEYKEIQSKKNNVDNIWSSDNNEDIENGSDDDDDDDSWKEKWKQENNAEYCPNCGVLVQRVSGCDWVKCVLCKHEFCWSCLEPHNHNMSEHVHGVNFKRRVYAPSQQIQHHQYPRIEQPIMSPVVDYEEIRRRAKRKRGLKTIKKVGFIIGSPVILGLGFIFGVGFIISGPVFYFHYLYKNNKQEKMKRKQRTRTIYPKDF